MSGEAPKYRTGVIWVVLTVLLVLGTVSAGFCAWGLLGLLDTHLYLLDGVVMVAGALFALFFLLLMAGVLYRIDRLRGTPHRRIELFE
ncbi:MAG: hypothetical protein ACRECR_02785 [Thermoplasmata archaeon]